MKEQISDFALFRERHTTRCLGLPCFWVLTLFWYSLHALAYLGLAFLVSLYLVMILPCNWMNSADLASGVKINFWSIDIFWQKHHCHNLKIMPIFNRFVLIRIFFISKLCILYKEADTVFPTVSTPCIGLLVKHTVTLRKGCVTNSQLPNWFINLITNNDSTSYCKLIVVVYCGWFLI